MADDKNKQWLYGKLSGGGVNVGSYEQFDKALSDEKNRKWAYDKATSMGLNVGDYDKFNSVFSPADSVKADVAAAQQTDQVSRRETRRAEREARQEARRSTSAPEQPQAEFLSPGREEGYQTYEEEKASQPVVNEPGYQSPLNTETDPNVLRREQQQRRNILNPDYFSNVSEDYSQNQYLADKYRGEAQSARERQSDARGAEKRQAKAEKERAMRIAETMQKAADLNPEYQKEVDTRLDAVRKDFSRTDEMIRQLYDESGYRPANEQAVPVSYGGGMSNPLVATEKGRTLAAAQNLMQDTEDILTRKNKFTDGKEVSGFAQGAMDEMRNPDFWTMQLTKISDGKAVRRVLEKAAGKLGALTSENLENANLEDVLSPEEVALVDAYMAKSEAEILRANDTALGYNAGKIAADSMKFMVEMALTGGIARSVNKGVMNVFSKRLGGNALHKWATAEGISLAQKAGRGALDLAHKSVKNLVAGGLDAAVAVNFTPSLYGNYAEQTATLDENGELRNKGDVWKENWWDSWKEYFTERGIGEAPGKVLGHAGKQLGISAYAATAAGEKIAKFAKRYSKALRAGKMATAGAFNNVGEYFEEYVGAVMDKYLFGKKDAVVSFWEGENLKTMVASFAPMMGVQAVAAGVNTASMYAADRRFEKTKEMLKAAASMDINLSDSAWDRFFSYFDTKANDADSARDIDLTGQEMVDQMEKFHSLVEAEKEREDGFPLSQQEQENLLRAEFDFFRAAAERSAVQASYEDQQAEKRQAKRDEIQESLGGKQFWTKDWDDETSSGNVTVVTTDKGRAFVISEKDNRRELRKAGRTNDDWDTYPVVYEDGTVGFVDPDQAINIERYSLDEYLDQQVKADQAVKDAASMNEQRITQIEDLKSQFEIGVPSPLNGLVPTDILDDGIIFSDGTELTWEQVGHSLGQPIQALSEEDAADVEAGAEAARDDENERLAVVINEGLKKKSLIQDANGKTWNIVKVLPGTIDQDSTTAQFLLKDGEGNYWKSTLSYDEFIDPDMSEPGEEAEAAPERPAAQQEEVPAQAEEAPQEEPGYKIPTTESGAPDFNKMLDENPAAYAAELDKALGESGETAKTVIGERIKSIDKQIADATKKADTNEIVRLRSEKKRYQDVLDSYENPVQEVAPQQNEAPSFDRLLGDGLTFSDIDDYITNQIDRIRGLRNSIEKPVFDGRNLEKFEKEKAEYEKNVALADSLIRHFEGMKAITDRVKAEVPSFEETAPRELTQSDLEPKNATELAAQMFSNNGFPITVDSYNSELIARGRQASGQTGENKKLIGFYRTRENGGHTIAEAAERLIEMRSEGYEGAQFADDDARDIIIDFLSGVETVGDINHYIERQRREQFRQEDEYAAGAMAQAIQEQFGMTVEQYEAQLDDLRRKRLAVLLENGGEIPTFEENEDNGTVSETKADGALPEEPGGAGTGTSEGAGVVQGEESPEQADTGEGSEETADGGSDGTPGVLGGPEEGSGAVETGEEVGDMPEEISGEARLDEQGNPIAPDGTLIIEKLESIDDLTDDDFDSPRRTVELPKIPDNLDKAIGADGKPVIIKKNIFEKNRNAHVDLSPEDSRTILRESLYNTNITGQTQPKKRPNYWVAIKTGDPSRIVILEVNEGKDNVEIVGWHYIDEGGIERLERQAEREDGQLLILTSDESEAAEALSTLPSGESESKDTTSSEENNTSEENTEEKPSESEENVVTSQEETKQSPASLTTKEEAQAYFEGLYGKGKKADNATRVWELTHKRSIPAQNTGNDMQQMAFNPEESGLTDEEAAELQQLGIQLAVDYIEQDGFVKFPAFFKNLVETFGDGIRPFAKAIYLGASANVADEFADQMDDRAAVRSFDENIDINDTGNEQDTDTVVEQSDGEPAGDTDGGPVGEGEPGSGGLSEPGGESGGPESDTEEGETEPGAPGEGQPGSLFPGEAAGEGGRTSGSGRGRGGRGSGTRGGRTRGDTGGVSGVSGGERGPIGELAPTEEQLAAAEQKAYEVAKETWKDSEDIASLKSLNESLKQLIESEEGDSIKKRERMGERKAVLERLREIFAQQNIKQTDLSQEKTQYVPSSDPEGKHAIGSVVPSGAADAMRDAIKKLEEEEGKSIAEFVKDELGYKSLEEMFSDYESDKDTGLAAEQVDSVGLAIHQMKKGRMFIVGDMTGVGKGRQGAALIRWAKKQGKKCLFVTQKSQLFSDMYGDLTDIGSSELLPFVINDDTQANITDKNGVKLIAKPSPADKSALFQSESDELPFNKKRKKRYDFVMMTYSQASAGEGSRVSNKTKMKLDWIKQYAKDAIVIMDESHTAGGASNQGKFFQGIAEGAEGVTFMSATYAKRPDNMTLYAIRSSMSEANMTREALIEAIASFGIPAQEILASNLFRTGEMVRRERDFSDVRTNWPDAKETFTPEEYEECRKTSDKTMGIVNTIIDFQRTYINPTIKAMNEQFEEHNKTVMLTGDGWVKEYRNTSYAGQVSNVVGLMLYDMKARKAAQMAIEQIKKGEKPVIAVENTLGSYVDQLGDIVSSASFADVIRRGLTNTLKYTLVEKQYKDGKPVPEADGGIRRTEFDSIKGELDGPGLMSLGSTEVAVEAFAADKDKMELPLSPIDYIKQAIADAGYKCGEITGRSNQLVKNVDGTYSKVALKVDKKKAARQFNGGDVKNPLPEEERLDALILNVAGATGISLHASSRFGDQRKRTMIILQAARDVNTEVQMRGRVDRTGQVSRAEYFYLTSPVPAEQKLTMMLRQKLASLDANAVGTEDVSSNRVDADDMDNKYGDQVAEQYLLEHLQDINNQLDNGLTFNNKTKEWEGHEGLLYDLMKGMQRLTCEEQEQILSELQNRYIERIEYLNQNGINDLKTSTLNLEAQTIDVGVFVKGKDNESPSEFAHDTNIERVEVNVLKKPLRSDDINKKMKQFGAIDNDGKLIGDYGIAVYQESVKGVQEMKDKKKAKHAEAEEKLLTKLRGQVARAVDQTEEEYEKMLKDSAAYKELLSKNQMDYANFEAELLKQDSALTYATGNLEPGKPYLVPLTDDISNTAPMMYGRFMGFKTKGGKPRGTKAIFAVKDSRAMIDIPVVTMEATIKKIVGETYSAIGLNEIGGSSWRITNEERRPAWDEWWDKMIPRNTSRQIRYMVTGNIIQACGSLGKYKGTITTFTRKDKETGEVTTEKGMLLAEDFDPENFKVRSKVTKDDIWKGYKDITDDASNIRVWRSGDNMQVKFMKRKGQKLADHPINTDEDFKKLTIGNQILGWSRDELFAEVAEENVEAALEHLFKQYGFTREHLFVMPDSTERVDAIVYSGKPYQEVIDELGKKYGLTYKFEVEREISQSLKTYKMDVNNDALKEKIRELVQLRQAYYRKDATREDSTRLAWKVLSYDQSIELAGDDKKMRDHAYNMREAVLEELEERGIKGTEKHYEQGKIPFDDLVSMFNEFNNNEENGEIAQKVFALAKDLDLDIVLGDKIDANIAGQTAGQVVEYNWKFFNAKFITDQMKADTILHELVHTMTVYAKKCVEGGYEHLITPEMVDAVNELDNIYNQIWRDPNFTHETYTDYGTANWYEMLSEAGSNEQFRNDLRQTMLVMRNKSGFITFFNQKDNKDMQGKVISAYDAVRERLDYLLDNFNKNGFKEYFRGTSVGDRYRDEMSEDDFVPRTPEEIDEKVNRMVHADAIREADPNTIEGRAELVYRANEIAGKFGVKLRGNSDLKGKAVFHTDTGEIEVNFDRHDDISDMEATVFHEIVGHLGLRRMFGEEFGNAMSEIYGGAHEAIRQQIDAMREQLAKEKRARGEEPETSLEEATEEYLAELAEDGIGGEMEQSLWQRVKQAFLNMLRRAGVNIPLTDADLMYVLWQSKRNLENTDKLSILELADRALMRDALRRQAESSHNPNPEDNGPFDGGGRKRFSARELAEEIQQMELIEGTENDGVGSLRGTDHMPKSSSINSITGANLLKGVRKTNYDEYILPEPAEPVRYRSIRHKPNNPRVKRTIVRNTTTDEENDIALRAYNRAANNVFTRFGESFIDMMNSLTIARDAMVKESGREMKDSEDFVTSFNTQSSRMHAMSQKFADKQLKAMREAIKDITDEFEDIELQDISRYVSIKSGLERNVEFAKRDAREWYQEEFQKAVEKVNADKKLTDEEKADKIAELRKALEEHLQDIKDGTDEKFLEYRKDDYGGITGWMSRYEDHAGNPIDELPGMEPGESVEEYNARIRRMRRPLPGAEELNGAEALAEAEVADFEAKISQKRADALWKSINDCTKHILRTQYKSNVISKAQFDSLIDRLKYYVPLRGFEEETAGDIYSYYGADERRSYLPPLLRAGGRMSRPDSPFGYIAGMADSAFSEAAKNDSKRALYRFISNRKDNSFATIADSYYRKTGRQNAKGGDIYQAVNAYTEIDPETGKHYVSDDMTMKAQREGFAKFKADMLADEDVIKGKKNLNLRDSVAMITQGEAESHIVRVKVLGDEYEMVFHGNPRMAQAINGELNSDSADNPAKRVLRFLASMSTSRNPAFWIDNFRRDFITSVVNLEATEDAGYVARMTANLKHAFRTVQLYLNNGEIKKAEPGTKLSELEAMWNQFVDNGGITGMAVISRHDRVDKQIEEFTKTGRWHGQDESWFVKHSGAVGEWIKKIGDFGESIEQIIRFATFMTSRQMGRGINRSIRDAKEVTVNFNRKGSGKVITREEAKTLGYSLPNGRWHKLTGPEQMIAVLFSSLAPIGRNIILFFNANMQGLYRQVNNFKASPVKTTAMMGGLTMMGFGATLLAGIFGGDDDDDKGYFKISEYNRNHRFAIPAFWNEDTFFLWPVPPEFAPFYEIGNIWGDALLKRRPDQNPVLASLAAMGQLLPANPAEPTSLIPAQAKPIIESAMNRNYMGQRIHGGNEYNKDMPGYTKAFNNTWDWLVSLSEIANTVSGGDYATKGWMNFNPAVAQHLIEGFGGGLLTFLGQIVTTAEDAISGKPVQLRTTPVVNRFFLDTDEYMRNSYINTEYYYFKGIADQTKSRLGKYQYNKPDEDYIRVQEVLDSKDYKYLELYNDYKKDIDSYQEDIKNAAELEEKRQLMAEQDELKKAFVDECIEIFYSKE